MKYAGIILIILSTTSAGALMSYSLREKELICRELVNLCDVISIDISYRKNSVMTLINDCAFKRLSFITPECITDRNALSSPLSSEENRELSGLSLIHI